MKSRKFPLGTKAPSSAARSVDIAAINDTIQRALSAAGLDTASGPMKEVSDTIRRAFSAAGLSGPVNQSNSDTIDSVCREIDVSPETDDSLGAPAQPPEPARPGTFVTRSFTNHAGTRDYKLYVPASSSSELPERLPLIVMLHGCTQSPDDFAAGTRMNDLAERHGFLAAYPAQRADANVTKCWNWFRPEDQEREVGEPSVIAGLTREIAASHAVDERRIFVAGMSAGAAMAVVLGTVYPDLYAAVGAHSGLAFGAAHDVPSALQAMKGNGSTARSRTPRLRRAVPTIVFHGDRDKTVDVQNASAIVECTTVAPECSVLHRTDYTGTAAGGRKFTRTVYADETLKPFVERWVIHGGGHAWSGGAPTGSFTDASGPDASAEMIRFFMSQLRAGTA